MVFITVIFCLWLYWEGCNLCFVVGVVVSCWVG